MLTSFGAGMEKEYNKHAPELEAWQRHDRRPNKARVAVPGTRAQEAKGVTPHRAELGLPGFPC